MLSEKSLKEIARNIAKYPVDQKQSAVMAALAVAQDEYGWLTADAIAEVATILDMPPIGVQEIATFYNMYNVAPTGKFKLAVCTNLPCELSGGKRAAEYLKQKLGIGFGETTTCGTFTLVEGECMGACGDAPVALINNKKMCSWMTNDKIDALLEELSANQKVTG
jgi:NADH-quinone oxidoreductase subunit E